MAQGGRAFPSTELTLCAVRRVTDRFTPGYWEVSGTHMPAHIKCHAQ